MIKLTSIEGNRQLLDGGSMFGNAPRPVWEKWIAPDEIGRIPLACRSLLIQTPNENILCETGIGAFFEPKLADRFGVQSPDKHLLLEELNQLGLNEDDIHAVILSHLHFDHAGGLLLPYKQRQVEGDRLLFPKAKYVIGEEAWQRAKQPHPRDRASFIPEIIELLETSGRLLLIKPETSSPWPDLIEFYYSHGHTPGQMHTLIKGTQQKAFFAGDLIPGKPWVHLPITMGYDRFPEQLIDEKNQLYDHLIDEDTWIIYTHDPEDACSKILKNEKGKYTPTDIQTQLRGFEL